MEEGERRGEVVDVVGLFGGGAGVVSDRKKVHPSGGFAEGPEPERFGELSLGKERASHLARNLPVPFDEAVLGLAVGRSSADANAMRLEEAIGRAADESRVKITLEGARETTCINEEAPEGVLDVVATGATKAVGPGVAGSVVDEVQAVFVATGGGAVAVADIAANNVEGFG